MLCPIMSESLVSFSLAPFLGTKVDYTTPFIQKYCNFRPKSQKGHGGISDKVNNNNKHIMNISEEEEEELVRLLAS